MDNMPAPSPCLPHLPATAASSPPHHRRPRRRPGHRAPAPRPAGPAPRPAPQRASPPAPRPAPPPASSPPARPSRPSSPPYACHRESEGDNADAIDQTDGQAQIDGDQEAVIQDRTESGDGGSAESTGKVDPQAPAWTKRVGNQPPDRATCPERVGTLEQTTLCEAYDFYNLDSWEHGFDIRTPCPSKHGTLSSQLKLQDTLSQQARHSAPLKLQDRTPCLGRIGALEQSV